MIHMQEMLACAEGSNREVTLLRTCRFLTTYLQQKLFNKKTAWSELNVIYSIIIRDFFMPGTAIPKHIERVIFRLNSMLEARGLPKLHTKPVLKTVTDENAVNLLEAVTYLRKDSCEN